MDLTLQPKPEVEITPADKGIITRTQYFVEKKYEKINQYCFPILFIRNWKPKAQLLYPFISDEGAVQYECDFNRNVQNFFVEDNAEEVFLKTPPPCFVIIGKFGRSVNKLGEEIAKEYGSVLIQVDDIASQVIQTDTETGKLLHRILRLGVSITLNFILALCSFLAHTPEARHRGYVICGLPKNPELYDLSVEQQFNYLFTWENKPTFFINVLFDDEDLIRERINRRCELKNTEKGKFILYHSALDNLSEDEDEVENPDEKFLLPVKERISKADINASPSRPWVKLPQDEEFHVWSELELFNGQLKPVIELLSSRVDLQYFLTVDSRVGNEFELVQARLNQLQIWKSPLPFPFIERKPTKTVSERSSRREVADEFNEEEIMGNEDPEILRAAEEPPQVAFLTLFHKKTLSPKFRWELSHYNYICPVSLREMEIVEGKSAYAVAFMKYIYFLRNEECMTKFLQNPRAFVLPVRPKPLCRFIILGFPFTGKTTLARDLAEEFSIPYLDLPEILGKDLNMKKNIYRKFCKEKAECREILRLTNLAWKDWRIEEDHRVALIEEWIAFIQTILAQRIAQFYSPETAEKDKKLYFNTDSDSEIHGEYELLPEEGKSMQLRGVAIDVDGADYSARGPTSADDESSPSVKIIRAMKHNDFDFNENSREVEANLFFSSLWNAFSRRARKYSKKATTERDGEENNEVQTDVSALAIDWYNLLPPQSLSSLELNRKPRTVREKRRSFHVLLEAASKNYWSPNALKAEFSKWRLPCFMDIPLCEIFLDNPILLLKYIPDWLKERPAIPEPVDPNHPSVIEAGNKAYNRSLLVQVEQNKQEVAILLRDAIEKAEREGMRVTGEVISPGGWVLDNMTLDLEVWKKLCCENVFADHIYILMDTDYKKVLSKCCEPSSPPSIFTHRHPHQHSLYSNSTFSKTQNTSEESIGSKSSAVYEVNLGQLLKENMDAIDQYEEDLDDIFRALENDSEMRKVEIQIDPFCQAILYNINNKYKAVKVESAMEDLASTILLHTESTNILIASRNTTNLFISLYIGTKLQVFGEKILNLFEPDQTAEVIKKEMTKIVRNKFEFLLNFLKLPKKLEELIKYLHSIDRGKALTKIDVTGKTPSEVFEDIKKQLLEPFNKKPRELEPFEVKEILKWTRKDNAYEDLDTEDEESEIEEDEEEDIRIFGESGSFCIVNLERNILLTGKPEFAVRYWGKLYYFWNEEAKKKFLEDPEKYAPYYSPIRCYPPLRIFVTGPIGTGKTKLCHTLAEQCSLNYVDYLTLLNTNLVPHLVQPFAKFTAINDRSLLLKEEFNDSAKAAKEKFMSAPSSYRTQWLESPFYSNGESYKDVLSTLKLSSKAGPSTFSDFSYITIEPHTTNEALIEYAESKPFLSMKEIEAILDKYIKNESDLHDYCKEKSIKKLWSSQPYVREGFVIESFPMRAHDLKLMLENNWIPDLIIDLNLSQEFVVESNTDALMELWDAKLQQETVEEKLLEDALEMIQRSCKWSRRDELMEEKMADALLELQQSEESSFELIDEENTERKDKQVKVRLSNMSQSMTVPAEMEGKILQEIEEILEEEFPPLEFNTVFETYEAGKERIIGDLVMNYQRDAEEIIKIKDLLRGVEINWYEINKEDEFEANLNKIIIILDKLKKRNNKKGEFAFTMKVQMAEKLLKQGYYFLSKFGRWCPVQVYRLKNSIHMFRPLNSRGKVSAIAYRNYIYFVAGENEKKKFLENPLKYTFNDPHHPIIPVRVAVIGPPKSGKTTLSSRLGAMFGLKVITMGTALRFVVEKMPNSTLSKNINCYLRRGCFLPLSLKIEALMASLNDPACVTQGFVFDGIPFDAALTQSLAERGKLPFVIISLTSDHNFAKANRQSVNPLQFRIPYKNRINLDMKYKDWNDTYKRFLQWNQLTYNNLYELNGKLSVVDIFYQAYDIIRKSMFSILHYFESCVNDEVLPLQYLCISQHEYELRKSVLENNCPVCWAELKRLQQSANPSDRSGLVQYLENFYWVCPEHMEKFKKTPRNYFPPFAEECPRILPKTITKEMYETTFPQPKIHGYGRCPVTRTDFPSRLDWEGSWNYAVQYAEKVYLCKNKEMMQRFLSRPWNYLNADTIFEVNRHTKSDAVELLKPPPLNSLPPVGFLEQTVSMKITEAVRIVGALRPLWPHVPLQATACVCLALILSSNNLKNKTYALARERLNHMLHYCRASNFAYKSLKPVHTEKGQGDCESKPFGSLEYEVSVSEEEEEISDNEVEEKDDNEAKILSASSSSFESCWMDVDSRLNKQMWSAHNTKLEKAKMRLNSDDELEEIPDHPKIYVILRYQNSLVRHAPLPPITSILTYIYSVQPNMQLPGPFNYNTLYQPQPSFSSPYSNTMVFNPKKEFSISLYDESLPDYQSKENIIKSPRAFSIKSSPGFVETPKDVAETKLVHDLLLPRFQLLDRLHAPPQNPIPRVKNEDIMVYNPQRDYAYMMLYAEFFQMSHVLRCYEWNAMISYLELDTRIIKNVGLLRPGHNFWRRPTRRPSVELKRPIDYYHDIFDACSKFVFPPQEEEPEEEVVLDPSVELANFIEELIWEKLDEIFTQVYSSDLSYESFETVVVESDTKIGKPSIIIREILPYPPLPWDIISRPYYAYRSLKAIFNIPSLDHIAHERHFSLLDGVEQAEERIRFVRYPSWLEIQEEMQIAQDLQADEDVEAAEKRKATCVLPKASYFIYDIFNLPWTSLMVYPFIWVYNKEITTCFEEINQLNE